MRRIGQCLNTKLVDIYKRAVNLGNISDKIINHLPEPLRAHFSVGSFTNGYLILNTPDPVWASQLRYQLPELRDTLRNQGGLYQLASIQININATTASQPTPPPKRYLSLSKKAKESILSTSELCDYEPLKQALKQLGRPPKTQS